MDRIFSIAIDGPAGAGKSSVAKAAAAQLGAVYLDTGAMYRTMGLYAQRLGLESDAEIARAAADADIRIEFVDGIQHMLLAGEDVTSLLREPEISMLASRVGTIPEVRTRLVALQQQFAKGHSVVMDGRDICEVVLPDATLKLFVTASLEERARRRFAELQARGSTDTFRQVLEEMRRRDQNDSQRAASPLRKTEDAILVDTTDMDKETSINTVVRLAEQAIAEKCGGKQ